MKKLSPFATNPFPSIKVSRLRIQKFLYNHIQRMIAIANPHFAAIIASTLALWTAIFGDLADYDQNLLKQVGLTKKADKAMADFIAKVVGIESLVAYKLVKNSSDYIQIFPHGTTEYHKATKANILVLMERVIVASHIFATQLGLTLEAEFIAIRDEYTSQTDDQIQEMELVDDLSPEFAAQKTAIFNQLYVNMITILLEYITMPRKMLTFFDETIVNFRKHTDNTHVLKIAPNSLAVADISFTIASVITIGSNYENSLGYFFAPTADTLPPLHPAQLEAFTQIEIPGTDTDSPNNKFLIFINTNNTEGKVEISVT